jgi:hypothetical protein
MLDKLIAGRSSSLA